MPQQVLQFVILVLKLFLPQGYQPKTDMLKPALL
jgi:hypothetical protein